MEPRLLEIQKLQFTQRERAEALLKDFLVSSGIGDLVRVELCPKPESLNSFNGFAYFESGQKLFFKSHVEEQEQVKEYYSKGLLEQAGYPLLIPSSVMSTPGKQVAFYEVVHFKTLFDAVKSLEDELLKGQGDKATFDEICQLQCSLDTKLFSVYQSTLETTLQSTASAPIHQLFSERLKDEGRVGLFYRGKNLQLAQGTLPFSEIEKLRWTINGVSYNESIAELIQSARKQLDSNRACPTIMGHGDAHNGNVFWDTEQKELRYFDAAFAGRHNPLLDLVKPLFHNVFTRWMYFPEQVSREISINYKVNLNTVEVQHDFSLSKLRIEILRSKVDLLLKPLVALLQEKNILPQDWTSFLHAALFCCPFLTVNLAAPSNSSGTLAERYSPSIKLLGLCMAIEVAAQKSAGRSSISDLVASIFE